MKTTQNKRTKLRKRADRVMQEYYRKQNLFCELCGKPSSCMHHFHVKSSCSALRYDHDNLISLCVKCHFKIHSSHSAEMTTILIGIRGQKWADDLLEKKKTLTVKPGIKYYEEIINKFK